MSKLRICVLIALTIGGAVSSATAVETTMVLVIGKNSCGYWQSNNARKTEGMIWILGFWSALNWANARNHQVGRESDSYGLVAEVQKRCAAHPSSTLLDAASRTYNDLDK
jgi:hypothetical protein